MGKQEVIETGVDKLVELIKKEKRISIKQASTKLGVADSLIEEWANFLEEEGLISIDYKLTTPYLVDRQLSKQEVEQKRQVFAEEKEILLRKAEHTLDFLNDQGQEIKTIREEFSKFKKDMDKDVSAAKKELAELEETLVSVQKKEKLLEQEVLRGRQATERFSEIVSKKGAIEHLVNNIDTGRQSLRQDIIKLIGIVKALSLSGDELQDNQHIAELKEKFAAVHTERASIDDELKKLSTMIKGMEH